MDLGCPPPLFLAPRQLPRRCHYVNLYSSDNLGV